MARKRPRPGDVFRLPIGEEVAFGQVLALEAGALVHLIVFEGLHGVDDQDVDEALSGRAELYAWASTRPFGGRWTIVDNRPSIAMGFRRSSSSRWPLRTSSTWSTTRATSFGLRPRWT
jgi:hypothetical protein